MTEERIIEQMARAMCAAGGCDPEKPLERTFRDELVGKPSWMAYVWQARSQRAAYIAMMETAIDPSPKPAEESQ